MRPQHRIASLGWWGCRATTTTAICNIQNALTKPARMLCVPVIENPSFVLARVVRIFIESSCGGHFEGSNCWRALGGHLEGSWRGQVESQRPPRGSNLGPRGGQGTQVGPKRCSRVPKLAPRGAQEAPSWVQEMAKSAQVEPKSSPRVSKFGGKGFQRALGEQHGDIRKAGERPSVKTTNFDDPPTLLTGFCSIRRALEKPKIQSNLGVHSARIRGK